MSPENPSPRVTLPKASPRKNSHRGNDNFELKEKIAIKHQMNTYQHKSGKAVFKTSPNSKRESKENLNQTSNAYLQYTSNMESKESLGTMKAHRRTLSMISAANTIHEKKRRQISEVRQGYKEQNLFAHTVKDVIRVLEHRITKIREGLAEKYQKEKQEREKDRKEEEE